jgi:hypothetical protein
MTNYTQQDYERDVDILRAIPKDISNTLTHIDAEGGYWFFDGLTYLMLSADKKSLFIPTWHLGLEQLRSLTDIRNLVAMYEREQEYPKYTTQTAELLAGIALRQLGDES